MADNHSDILIASQLQNASHFLVSMTALMVHEWLILFDREVEHIWRKDWNISKILFVISRYGVLLDIPIAVATRVAPYGVIDYGTCRILYKIYTWLTFLGISVSDSVLLLRTIAIYSGSKRIKISLTITYVIATVAGGVFVWIYLRTPTSGPPPGTLIGGCYLVRKDATIFLDYVLFLSFEFVVVTLTVVNGYKQFRSGTPLMKVIYRDSAAFFVVLFVFSLSTLLVLAPLPYGGVGPTLIRVMHSIICCRIILNIRQAASPGNTSTAASTGLIFATPPEQQANHADTMQLEAHGTRGDEE